MSEYVSPKHADLVAAYKRAQEETPATVWPARPQAPYRIRAFAPVAPAEDASE